MIDLINYSRLHTVFRQMAPAYAEQTPFPHAVIDEFLTPDAAEHILTAFSKLDGKSESSLIYGSLEGEPTQLKKRWLAMELKTPAIIRQLYRELMSADFISLLELLTGIDGLLPDPHLMGGGQHETLPGGYLKVHADFNVHPNFHLYRRLNLLIYLNRDWQPEWQGDLELWDSAGKRCVKKIAPLAGRAVIFSTSSCSFHGHPSALACPDRTSRKSIALYYYNQHCPPNGEQLMHMTLWRKS